MSNQTACGVVEDLVRTFGEVRIRVFGTSMMPALNPGDVVSIQGTAMEEVWVGEIVVFTRDGRLFAHRVVEKIGSVAELRLITRGDRLPQNDPPVTPTELLGRITGAERNGKRIDPNKPLGPVKRAIAPLLKISEHATFAYMRFLEFQRAIFLAERVR